MPAQAEISEDPYALSIEEIDMSDGRLYEQGLAGKYFARLRAEAPVHFCPESDVGPFWSITKFNDIMEVDRNHAVFSADASRGGHLLGFETWFRDDPEMRMEMIIAMDPPRHDVQRRAVSPVVAAGNLRKMESGIRKNVCEILDSLPEGETFNWVDDVSIELTTRTLAVLFDFPFEERRRLTRWSDLVLAVPGDGIVDSWDQRKTELIEMTHVFRDLWNDRKGKMEGFDLVSMLANSLDADSISDAEYMGNVILLLLGGDDTTRNLLTASVLTLNRFPDQNELLRANQDLIPSFCSEVIRWQTPLPHMKRTALKDVEIRGHKIREGEKIAMWYMSGNRDEKVFERPHELVIDRPNVRNHLAFGFGLHRCVGNRLAELQLKIAWEEILKRFKSVTLDGDPVRNYSHAIMGYSDLPVRVQRY